MLKEWPSSSGSQLWHLRKPSARYSWWDVVSCLLLASRTVLKCLSRAKSSKWRLSAIASPRLRHALATNIRESSHISFRCRELRRLRQHDLVPPGQGTGSLSQRQSRLHQCRRARSAGQDNLEPTLRHGIQNAPATPRVSTLSRLAHDVDASAGRLERCQPNTDPDYSLLPRRQVAYMMAGICV